MSRRPDRCDVDGVPEPRAAEFDVTLPKFIRWRVFCFFGSSADVKELVRLVEREARWKARKRRASRGVQRD